MGERPALFVVGASHNVGYAVAKRFAKEGYDVCLTNRSQSAAEESAREIGEMYPGVRVYGIRCNLLISGPMSNDDWKKMSGEELARRRHILPAGRESSPDDAANCVWFLCSDEAATITGSEHIVDSGLNLPLRNYAPDWDIK